MTGRGRTRFTAAIRRVSIVVPTYNEAEHVEHLVEDVARQDFAGEVEVFVADGRSSDGSVERLREAARRRSLDVTIVDNPARWVSPGLNACIERARGDLIVRLDCHSRYPADYVSRTVAAAEETGAWAVGAVADPVGRTPMERAVACALDGPFGGAHWTRHGRSSERVEVDNFYLGAFRPEALARAGLFDETLVRNQDDELNLRIRRSGGFIVLDPTIRVAYTPRGSLGAVFRQYYQYGLWKVPVMRKHGQVLSARSLAPIVFTSSLAGLAAGGIVSRRARGLLALETGAYLSAALLFGAGAVRRRREPWSLLPRVLAVYPTSHAAYGLGMVAGLVHVLRRTRADAAPPAGAGESPGA